MGESPTVPPAPYIHERSTPMNKRTHELLDIDDEGFELTADELKLVHGGQRPVGGHSKVCDVGGGCWSDTGF